MQITNSHPNNRNINFQALPGGKIRAILINQPEKFQAIKEQLAPLGDPNTVVDIFTATKKSTAKVTIKIADINIASCLLIFLNKSFVFILTIIFPLIKLFYYHSISSGFKGFSTSYFSITSPLKTLTTVSAILAISLL